MKMTSVRSLVVLAACLLIATAGWVLISIVGYEMTFNRTEFDGLKKGMSRVEALAELKKIGVVELEAIPDDEPSASKNMDDRGGYWVNLKEKDYDLKMSQHDTWRYQVPNSYSTVDIKFKGSDLISIKYRWRPFEG
jgi:hypothetical protein